jgi:PAS domain S-box-containing protein
MRVAREKPASAKARVAADPGFTRLLVPPALGWALLLYTVLAVASGWAYATLRIRTDRIQTMHFERDGLHAVAVALRSAVGAMLNDGVGAAVAAVNASVTAGGLDALSDPELLATLRRMLTGGEYVRSLYLLTPARFVRAGRGSAFEIQRHLPEWFPASELRAREDTWVGKLIADPELPGAVVVPVARRVRLESGRDVWAGTFINFHAFQVLHSQVARPSSSVGLVSTDGTLLLLVGAGVAENSQLAPGSNIASSPLFRRAPLSSESGVVEGFAPRFGAEMVVAYARVGEYPLTIIIAQPVDSLLIPWRERTRDTLIVTAVSSVLVLGLTVLLMQHLARRRRAEQELRESEGRYRSLVEALPEAVFVHRGGELLFANTAASKLVGAESAEWLIGKPVMSFAVESDRDALAERSRRILEHSVAVAAREAQVRRLDGSLVWVEVEGVPIEFAGAAAVQSVMHDITARKLREAAETERTHRTERQGTALVSLASRDGGGSDLRGALRRICSRAAEVLDVDRGSVWLLDEAGVRWSCVDLYEPALRCHMQGFSVDTASIPLYLAALRTERVIATPELQGDPRLRELAKLGLPTLPARSLIAAPVRSSGGLAGAVTFEEMSAARVWHEDEVGFAAGIADQVARTLLDAQREQVLAELRVLAGELMRSQDEERRRIGRDLHDSTGQTLVALELDLARLENSAASLTPEERSLLAQCAQLAHQCSTEIRTASYLLHPPLLDERGLVSALRWLADGVRERGGIEVRLELPESVPRMPPEEELTLFRVAQETLTNVLRHAASPWVGIRLTVETNSMVLEIEDAGRGIATPGQAGPADGGARLGVGLAGMRERIRQVGGVFEFESTSGGTRIRATLPRRAWPDLRSA